MTLAHWRTGRGCSIRNSCELLSPGAPPARAHLGSNGGARGERYPDGRREGSRRTNRRYRQIHPCVRPGGTNGHDEDSSCWSGACVCSAANNRARTATTHLKACHPSARRSDGKCKWWDGGDLGCGRSDERQAALQRLVTRSIGGADPREVLECALGRVTASGMNRQAACVNTCVIPMVKVTEPRDEPTGTDCVTAAGACWLAAAGDKRAEVKVSPETKATMGTRTGIRLPTLRRTPPPGVCEHDPMSGATNAWCPAS